VIPFGNGPERMLNNCKVNFNIKKMDLNRHNSNNMVRATVEAIAFSFVYGIKILKAS
jgi:xylulokinase